MKICAYLDIICFVNLSFIHIAWGSIVASLFSFWSSRNEMINRDRFLTPLLRHETCANDYLASTCVGNPILILHMTSYLTALTWVHRIPRIRLKTFRYLLSVVVDLEVASSSMAMTLYRSRDPSDIQLDSGRSPLSKSSWPVSPISCIHIVHERNRCSSILPF